MRDIRFCRADRADWLATGPLAAHLDAYKQDLTDAGYAAGTIGRYLAGLAHLSLWMRRRRFCIERISEALVAEFLDDHLPRCRCHAPVVRDRSELSSSLRHLLVVLRDREAIAPPAVSQRPVDVELRRDGQYMTEVRGLAPKTRSIALRIVGRLLSSRFGNGPIDIAAIKPDHVRRFFAQQAKLYSKPVFTGSVVASLRGYFRYRATLGDTVHALVGALSYPANWQLASLPKALKPEEVEQLIRSLGQIGPSQRRADAIVRCALDLGLRSCEIARLHLDDVDWQAGTITLRHTKGRRDDILPLPATTGEAIAAYLRLERPKTVHRAVFARHVAPREQLVGPDLVRKTIRQAYARAGLPHTRSHLLRHTMASRLLAGGSSLKEVADVLRHRSLNTTLIYAKLDSRSLTEVALPWPGSTP
jgi:site-specific recombinase XerD